MKEIVLKNGYVAFVDDEDFEYLNQWLWLPEIKKSKGRITKVYARTNINGERISMHRLLLKTESKRIDHQDGNGLNNQKNNIRAATPSQNGANRKKNEGFSSKYLGVSWDKRKNRWKAQLTKNGKMISIGSFKNEEDAAKAYDNLAVKLHGEFATTNF